MCGIVGVLGKEYFLVGKVIEKLARLEYRGYDSFGVAFRDSSGQIVLEKHVGAVSKSAVKLGGVVSEKTFVSLGHTRWATHGVVSVQNAHPHQSSNKKVSLVHNGVIENFDTLQHNLISRGKLFNSETDTEVVANQIEYFLEAGRSDESAILDTAALLQGSFALCVILSHKPDSLYCITHKSSLVFGQNQSRAIVASDPLALAPEFSDYSVVPEDTLLELSRDKGCGIFLKWSNIPHSFAVETRILEDSEKDAGCKGFPDFMSKEMADIPNVILAAQRNFEDIASVLSSAKRALFLGCGSAFYASGIGAYFLRDNNNLLASYIPSDEVLSIYPTDESFTESLGQLVVFAVSQSGETFDTLSTTRALGQQNHTIVAITNGASSALSRESSIPVIQNAGRELCVLSTKSILSQVALFAKMFDEDVDLVEWSTVWEDAFLSNGSLLSQIKKAASMLKDVDHVFYVGRDVYRLVAQESALKLKEASYIHAEGLGAGFFKHGTLSLIDDRFWTVAHIPDRDLRSEDYNLTLANCHEIAARGGKIIGVGHGLAEHRAAIGVFEHVIDLPKVDNKLSVALQLGVGQHLSYFTAKALGRDVDHPRNLAKSVTVL